MPATKKQLKAVANGELSLGKQEVFLLTRLQSSHNHTSSKKQQYYKSEGDETEGVKLGRVIGCLSHMRVSRNSDETYGAFYGTSRLTVGFTDRTDGQTEGLMDRRR